MPVSFTTRTPHSGRRRRLSAVLIVAGILLLLAGGLMRAGGERPTAGPRSFAAGGGGGGSATLATVNLTDAPSYTPNSVAATAGKAVAFHLVNVGSFAHTFTLSSVANLTLNQSWSPGQLDAFFHANAAWENISLAPGTNSWANFTVPDSASGSYEFVSFVPYQFQAGMFGFLNVTSGSGGGGVTLQEATAGAGLSFVPAILNTSGTTYPLRIHVAIQNLGSNAHTWTLVAQPNVNVTAGDFTSYFQSHPPAANVNVPTTPGQVVWANFTVTQKGVYQFICEVPGHLGAGMEGALYVGIPAPHPQPEPSAVIVEPLLLAGGGAVLGLGVLLAAVASLVGRIPPPAYKPGH